MVNPITNQKYTLIMSNNETKTLLTQILQYEENIKQSRQNINDIIRIIKICRESEISPVILCCLDVLYRIFCRLFDSKELYFHQMSDEDVTFAKIEYTKWLQSRYYAFINLLLQHLHVEEPKIQVQII